MNNCLTQKLYGFKEDTPKCVKLLWISKFPFLIGPYIFFEIPSKNVLNHIGFKPNG